MSISSISGYSRVGNQVGIKENKNKTQDLASNSVKCDPSRVNKSRKLSFGCRLASIIKAEALTEEDKSVRRQILLTSPNSLKVQSHPGLKHTNGAAFAKDGVPHDVDTLFHIYKEQGNGDGSGVSFHKSDGTAVVRKSKDEAAADSKYDAAVNEAIESGSKDILAHIRLASPECRPVDEKNAHPFVYGNLTCASNGFIAGALRNEIKDKVFGEFAELLGDKPKGTTDTEVAFFYFLGNLKKKHGSTDPKVVGMDNFKKVFAESIVDLIDLSPQKFWKLNGNTMGLKGELDVSPACNFIISNGDMHFGFRKGHELFYGLHEDEKGEKEYILSSQIIKTEGTTKPIEWIPVTEEHIITFSKNDAGKIEPELTPLASLVPDYDETRERRKSSLQAKSQPQAEVKAESKPTIDPRFMEMLKNKKANSK